MFNLKELEQLRDKKEIFEYFKAKGIKITHQQINKLKQNYENLEYNADKLTTNQLDKIAGGVLFVLSEHRNVNLLSTTRNLKISRRSGNEITYRDINGLDYAKELLGNEYKNYSFYFENPTDASKVVFINLNEKGKFDNISVHTCRQLSLEHPEFFKDFFRQFCTNDKFEKEQQNFLKMDAIKKYLLAPVAIAATSAAFIAAAYGLNALAQFIDNKLQNN